MRTLNSMVWVACLLPLCMAGRVVAQRPLFVAGSFDTSGSLTQIVEVEAEPGEPFDLPLGWAHDQSIIALTSSLLVPAEIHILGADLLGTLPEAVGTEYFAFEVDDQAADGRAILLSLILDASPPFDGQVLPPTLNPQPFATLRCELDSSVSFGDFLPVEFSNDLFPGESNLVFESSSELAPVIAFDAPGVRAVVGRSTDTEYLVGRWVTTTLLAPYSAPGELFDLDLVWSDPTNTIQGLQVALELDPLVRILSVDVVGTDLEPLAEFVGFDAESDADAGEARAMTVGIILDFQPPFDGQVLEATSARQQFATIRAELDASASIGEHLPVTFRDGLTTTPGGVPVDNHITSEGETFAVRTFTAPSLAVVPPFQTQFLAGRWNPETFTLESTPAPFGQDFTLELNWTQPDANVQGFQGSVILDSAIQVQDLDVEGTILAEVGTEFVVFDVTPDNGVTFGILLDALPPFDNQTVPPTAAPLVFGNLRLSLDDSVSVGDLLSVELPPEGVLTPGGLITQFVLIDSVSTPVREFQATPVEVTSAPFIRGDANQSGTTDIADVIYLLSFLFIGGDAPPCRDAADSNSDGVLDSADAIYSASHYFSEGPPPMAPYPNCGSIPEGDCISALGCTD